MAALEQNPADELVDYEEDEQQNDTKVKRIFKYRATCPGPHRNATSLAAGSPTRVLLPFSRPLSFILIL